jgi:hypothetical protein
LIDRIESVALAAYFLLDFFQVEVVEAPGGKYRSPFGVRADAEDYIASVQVQ